MVISCCLRLIIYFSVCMIGKKIMTKYCLGTAKMNKKQRLIMFLSCTVMLSGCSAFYPAAQPSSAPVAPRQTEANSSQEAIKNIPPASNDFVQHTDVAADYKEYGERTPRDQLIVQGGAGSNLSSSIPPTIEDEVVDYEESVQISETEEVSDNQGANNINEDPVEDWLAEEGKSLKTLLTEWSDRAGWRLIWNTNRNYTLTAGAMFRGRFADVSSALIRAFARAKPAPIATFYKGNRVLVVETLEDENAYE